MSIPKFELKFGRWTKSKSPQSDLFYAVDLAAAMAAAGTTLHSVVSTIVQGVVVTTPAAITGSTVYIQLSGLDTADGAQNFCTINLKCAYGSAFETFPVTMWFEPM